MSKRSWFIVNASMRRLLIGIAIVFALAIFTVLVTIELYTEWAWFSSEGFSSVFWTMFFSKLGLRVISGIFFFIILYFNLSITRKAIRRYKSTFELQDLVELISEKRVTLAFIIASVVLALLLSSLVATFWTTTQQYINRTEFGVEDPIFGNDISFYVFVLPMYRVIYSAIMVSLVLSLFIVTIIYAVTRAIDTKWGTLVVDEPAKKHIPALVGSIILLKGVGYILNTYQLLQSTRGPIIGATYADVNAAMPALYVLAVVSVICAVLAFADMFRRGLKLTMAGVVILVLLSFLVGTVWPGFVQALRVNPNELRMERPFIEHNLEFTRKAYGLDNIIEHTFPATATLTYEDIIANRATIDNIRIWDEMPEGPLIQTYAEIQQIRPYYEFRNVDVARYTIGGNVMQVMLSARHMNPDNLERAQTWVNQHLVYTHGFGVVMSPANKATRQGLPDLIVKDIPPTSRYEELAIERPEIYFGEGIRRWVIVNTRQQEFSYPLGDRSQYATYEGDAGVQLNSFISKVLWGLRLADYNMILSQEITNESRLLVFRHIEDRVKKIAPFIKYDRDPYMVIADGQLYWIMDAYTTTPFYPYSEPYSRWGNYIRNSIKVVVNAYTGEMTYYIFDDTDPVVLTWQGIFPELFRPFEEMPDKLKPHIRYPKDLFEIQSRLITIYHMTDAGMFYNKEDEWEIAREIFGDPDAVDIQAQMRGDDKPGREVRPYYVTMKLPGDVEREDEEFILMLPYTPKDRNNMISWLAARSDGDNYGQLHLYRMPRGEMIYGPFQIEARIDQMPDIAREFTLWGQAGSDVIRGNLIVLPIEESILYIEPIYLRGELSQLPELRRIIVVYGDRVSMQPTLELALADVLDVDLGEISQQMLAEIDKQIGEPDDELAQLSSRVVELYQEAQRMRQEERFQEYGEVMIEFESVFQALSQKLEEAELELPEEARLFEADDIQE